MTPPSSHKYIGERSEPIHPSLYCAFEAYRNVKNCPRKQIFEGAKPFHELVCPHLVTYSVTNSFMHSVTHYSYFCMYIRFFNCLYKFLLCEHLCYSLSHLLSLSLSHLLSLSLSHTVTHSVQLIFTHPLTLFISGNFFTPMDILLKSEMIIYSI